LPPSVVTGAVLHLLMSDEPMIFSGEDRRKVRYEKAKTEDTTYEKSKIDPHGIYLRYPTPENLSARLSPNLADLFSRR